MFKSYLKIAVRNLVLNKTLAVIKLAGLSIGLCVCMLILLYTKDEISYDRFHANSPRLYRVVQAMQLGKDAPQKMAITQPGLGVAFKREIPEVQHFVRITNGMATVKVNNEVFSEFPLMADSNLLSVFSFPLIKGNAASALENDHSVILSETAAKKYFGTGEAVGQILQVKFGEAFENFTVTAVAKNAPENSTIKFGLLIPASYLKLDPATWIGGSLNTFLLLSPRAEKAVVEKKMQQVFDINTKAQVESFRKEQNISATLTLSLQPLTDIHLNPRLGPVNGLTDGSHPRYSYVLTWIAAFVLLMACINFINLAVAQSLKRSKEIGVRKVMGGTSQQLIGQFLTESVVVSLIAFVVAFGLMLALLPLFNEMANKKLNLSYLSDPTLYITLFLLLVATSFIAGFYPSLVMSRFQPVKVLYKRQKLMVKNYLTKGLMVLQFTLAIFLIIGTFTMNKQVKFLLHSDPGYDMKNMVQVKLPFSKTSDRLPALFSQSLSGKKGIVDITARSGGVLTTAVKAGAKQIIIRHDKIDPHFLPTLKIPVIAGRNLSTPYPSDSSLSVIVNESFLQEAGWSADQAIGKRMPMIGGTPKDLTIVGVIKNYHFNSKKEKITPQLLSMDPGMNYGEVFVKMSPGEVPQAMAQVKEAFSKLVPFYPYEFNFLEDSYANQYGTEVKGSQMVSMASVIFIFISCIGLFGLVMLSVEQRSKEIGIRKVLGAAVSSILLLISKEFLGLILIAFVVAIPVAYYTVSDWLQDFPYRTAVGWWVYALPGLLALAIALATISFQAIKAALANPVKSLRSE